ncbi:hypothetical protein GCM10027073_52510 [Streptomyces chlorus]
MTKVELAAAECALGTAAGLVDPYAAPHRASASVDVSASVNALTNAHSGSGLTAARSSSERARRGGQSGAVVLPISRRDLGVVSSWSTSAIGEGGVA